MYSGGSLGRRECLPGVMPHLTAGSGRGLESFLAEEVISGVDVLSDILTMPADVLDLSSSLVASMSLSELLKLLGFK